MVTIRQTLLYDAIRTRIFIGFDENLKQTTLGTVARRSQPPKRWHVDDNMANFQKISQPFPDLGIIKGLGEADPAPAPGLQNSHDIAPITSPTGDNALLPPEVAEHKAEKPENAGSQAEFTHLL